MQSHVQRPFIGWLLLHLSLLTNQASAFSLSNLFSALSDPSLSISTSDSAQQFEGWGTSLAWFGEYVGSLEGVLDRAARKLTAALYLLLSRAAH